MKAEDFQTAIARAAQIALRPPGPGRTVPPIVQALFFLGALKGGLESIDPKLAALIEPIAVGDIHGPAVED